MVEADKLHSKLPEQEFDYFKIGKILISRWYWIVLSVMICTAAAEAYVYYTPKTYSTSATMKLEEKKSDISDLVNVMGSSDKGTSKTQSEMYVLQSPSLIRNAVKHLDYQVSFFVEGRIRTTDIYTAKPLDIKLIRFDTLSFYNQIISYTPVNTTTYTLKYNYNGKDVKNTFFYNQPANIGQTFFSISYPGEIKTGYLFKFNSPDDFVWRIKGGLQMNEVVKNSNIIRLEETDLNARFAADALNAILTEYLNYDRDHKQQSATQIIKYIDAVKNDIADSVRRSENRIGDYKTSAQIMDVTSSAQTEIAKANAIEVQRDNLKIQLNSIQLFKQQINKEKENISLNFNIGDATDQLMNKLITDLNNLYILRTSYLKTYTSNSGPIQEINQQIAKIRNDILTNINYALTTTQKKINDLDGQLAQINQKISTFPTAERELVKLNRDFEVNEKVLNFLSEKNLDARISKSSILPGATIIEQAIANDTPVSPNEHQIRQTNIIRHVKCFVQF